MSQPPYPPPGEGARPGDADVPPLPFGPDQPTQRLGPANPGQREPTRQFSPTGPWPGAQPGALPGSHLAGSPDPASYPRGATPPPAPRKSNTVLVILVIAASLVLIAVMIALVVALEQS